jgi:broad specificity phosphatase PhoE
MHSDETPIRPRDEAAPAPLTQPPPGPRGLVDRPINGLLVFVRHGQTTDLVEGRIQGQRNVPLSALGERQASLTAERFASRDGIPGLPVPARSPVAIRHSPLLRTTRTAAVIARSLGVEDRVEADDDLREMGFGVWEGLTVDEIDARYPGSRDRWLADPTRPPDHGEDLGSVDRRVRRAIGRATHDLGESESRAEPPWLLLVGHGGAFQLALAGLLGLPLTRFWSFAFDLCGISVVEIHPDRATVRAHNLTDHLAGIDLSGDGGSGAA